ncbi:hypothetical protein VAEKB19_2650002 [Vibrio aestuarianus]|nr:hypothetical protein VAEKB19_2650002 [Vibrio aestuarianus]
MPSKISEAKQQAELLEKLPYHLPINDEKHGR